MNNSTEYNQQNFANAAKMLLSKKVRPQRQERRLRVIGKWIILTRKMLHLSERKSRNNMQQWKHFATSLIKINNNYRLYV